MSTDGDFYSEHTVKGRAAYVCQFCRHGIAKGALHVCVSSRSGGVYRDHRAHTNCHEAATGQPAPAYVAKRRNTEGTPAGPRIFSA